MMTYWAGDVKENAASFRPQDKGPQQPHPDLDKELLLAEVPYLTFDDPLNREFATRDPNGFLDQFHGKTAILDEIQYVPGILPYIKIRIDKDRRPGSWVLTGSQRFSLMRGVSETLAGWIAVLELAPFNPRETECPPDRECPRSPCL
jgi:predicted AAA+ superfamily ATPase